MRRTLTVAGTIFALVAGATAADAASERGVDAPASAAKKRAPAKLSSFRSCRAMKRYAARHAGALRESVSVGGGALEDTDGSKRTKAESPQGADPADGTSGTNVQEPGVDEPDLVKSQGDRLFTVADGRLVAMETGPGTPRELGSVSLGRKSRGEGAQLLLRGSRALVLNDSSGGLVIQEVDITDPAAMRVTGSIAADGALVDARQHDGVARIAIQSGLDLPPQPQEDRELRGDAKRERNPIAKAKPRSLLPNAKVSVAGRTRKRALVPCASVRRPASFAGLDVMTVLTVDLDRGLPAVDSDAVMMSGETVYASAESLYVATGSFHSGRIDGPTEIHRFSIEGATTTYEASGSVTGTMLSQFSMSEHEGVLRVASTKERLGRNRRSSQSFVTTLAQSGDQLVPVGRVGGLGQGERIFAVRFLGDTGYVVTFRQVDPLYTLDLSVPSAPAVIGELKVRGYSAYLHPVGPGRLLGVGQDATPDGFARGTQVSLFDVSNLAAPSLLSQAKLGEDSSSEVEFDHHAFLYWEPTSLVVIPVSVFGPRAFRPSFEGAVAFRTNGSVQEVARLTHGPAPPPISRAIVNSGRLVTLSERGVLVSDIDALTPVGWIPLQP